MKPPVLLACITAGVAWAADTSAVPTFARDVAPIIYQNCSACHRPGAAGPFSLLSYQDVKKHATQIAAVTERHYMPPWPPQAGHGHFQDERRLSDEQIRTIANWVQAGAPEGLAAEEPAAPQFTEGWQLGPPDLVLKATRPHPIGALGPDEFWNFVFRPDVKTVRYVRAIEIRPGGRNVHHANLLIDRMGATRAFADGFGGMDLTLTENPFEPQGHFLFWKPGSLPYSEPDGFSWRLSPGDALVLNTHIQTTGKAELIEPTIGLYFTDKPPTKFPILVELEHDEVLKIPAGDRDFVISDHFTMPVDADLLAIYPHAHYLGTLLEAYVTLPNGDTKWLIRIPHWDLNWQAVYRYREPVFLPKGSVVEMRYHYDNSTGNPRNPHNPPQRVEAGNQATDEMGHLWLELLPRGSDDRRRQVQEAVMRRRLEKNPNDFSAHLNLGAILLSRLNRQEAVTELKEAVKLDERRPEAHDMLGEAMEGLGFTQEASSQFRLALLCDGQYVNARYDLANALVRMGKVDEAVENFRAVVKAFPDSARMHNQFGVLLVRDGKMTEAMAEFDRAIALEPNDDMARKNREALVKETAGR